MILVDSSVWIEHFKSSSRALKTALETEEIVSHPYILGELALGNYKNRIEILDLLRALPLVDTPTHEELLLLIEKSKLFGKGLGWVDVNLLASSLLSGCRLWTYDQALLTQASRLKINTLND